MKMTSELSTDLSPTDFVNELVASEKGYNPTPTERIAFVNEFGNSTTTENMAARARVVSRILEAMSKG